MNHIFIKSSAVIFILLAACLTAQTKDSQIVQAMKHYDNLILKMNTDSIAQMYTVDGQLGKAAMGRDSIKSFLDRFKNFKVKLQESTSRSITFTGDTAIQKGTYHQITNVPNHGDIDVKGSFDARWVKVGTDWLLKRMDTKNN